MGSKRAYFGTLPLWSHYLQHEEMEPRVNPVDVVAGVDQARALHISASENVSTAFDVLTWAGPPTSARSQEEWIAARSAMRAAVLARMRWAFPLVIDADDALDRTIESGAGDTYVFTLPHGFAVGDVLYFVRTSNAVDLAALRQYAYGTVESIGAADEVTLTADPTTEFYSPEAGDLVVRASHLWDSLYCPGPLRVERAKTGDYYSPAIVWPFVGSPLVERHSVTVNAKDRP